MVKLSDDQHQVVVGYSPPHGATGMLSIDKGDVRVSSKLEPLVVQLGPDAAYNLAPCPRHVQYVKSAFGVPNARFLKLSPLKINLPNAKAKLLRLVKRKKHAPTGVGPSSPFSLKCLCPDAPGSNARLAFHLSRDARRAFHSRVAKTASLKPASRLCSTWMPPVSDVARLVFSIPLPWI